MRTLRRYRDCCAVAAGASAVVLGACGASAQSGFVNWESAHVTPLALTPSGSILLAVNTADDRLEVFDLTGPNAARPKLFRSIFVGVDPISVRARTESEAWVVNQISDTVSIVDLPTGRVTRTLLPGDEPADVGFAAGKAFVTCAALNQVKVYDLSNLTAAPTSIPIAGADPRAVAVSADGTRVYVAIFNSGNATTIVRRQDVSNPAGPYGGVNPPPNSGAAFDPPKTPILPAPPQVAMIVKRSATGAWMDDNSHNWSAFVPWNLADNDVAIIDSTTLAVTYAKGMLSTVMALGVRPDGTVTPVGLDAKNEVRFEPNAKARFVRVEMGSFNPSAPARAGVVDLNPHLIYTVTSVPQGFRDVSIGDPRGVVWHPTSGRAYVGGMGSNSVIVTDASGARYAEISVGKGPTGLAMLPDGSRVYVLNKFDGTISSIDTTANTETSRVAFPDPTPSTIKLGRPLLYDTHRTSGLGQASCASCHIDGRSDFLAWDLGNPAGLMKEVNGVCFTALTFCAPWHPMKGPMLTQVLQGIVGVEPLHWRGDRENVAAFGPAFTGLQGMDAEPSATELTQFTNFIATIKYPPNSKRDITDLMPSSMPTAFGTTGNPNNGAFLFQSLPVIGSFKCTTCHTMTSGSNQKIDDANTSGQPQSIKMAQLRGLSKKLGFDKGSLQSIRGFGFNHDSEFDSLYALLNGSGFQFAFGSDGEQQKHDLEAFLMCFPSDTHPAVGQQITFDGTNNNDPATIARLNTFVTVSNTAFLGLIAKGRVAGKSRGWYYYGADVMRADRHGEQTTITALRTGAAPGGEITFTLVPPGSQLRLGIDRDEDGWYDAEELAACSNPGDPTSFPGSRGCVDVNASLTIDVADIFEFLTIWFSSNPRADFDGSGTIDVTDIFAYLDAWFTTCAQ